MAKKKPVDPDEENAAAAKACKAMGQHLIGLEIVAASKALALLTAATLMTMRHKKKKDIPNQQFFDDFFIAFRHTVADDMRFLEERDRLRAIDARMKKKRKDAGA